MEIRIIELVGIAIKFILKCWAKDAYGVSETIVTFAQRSKLSLIEARKFNSVFEHIENQIAEDMLKRVQNENMEEERKQAIIEQIINDIKKINLDENKFLYEDLDAEKIKKEIMSYSEGKRKIWDESDRAFYSNYVKYLSKCMVEFVYKLPMYEQKALKLIIDRQREYKMTLDVILKEIHSVKEVLKNTDGAYREFEEAYREYIIDTNQKVELIGSGIQDRKLRKYDISAAYVDLSCIEDDTENDTIQISDVFQHSNVVWIRGEAGAGKTTFLQWVALCSAKNEVESIPGIKNTVPIIVRLRSAIWPLNLVTQVRKCAEGIDRTYPDDWTKRLLSQGRALILIDGLDEIEQTKREEVYEFVKELIIQYPGVKILITARNSVKDKLDCYYRRFEICPMKMEGIKEFIYYWHKAVLYDDDLENAAKITELKRNLINKISENPSLKNLVRNPLLCAMICALNYSNNEYLPSNRNDIYDKCCEMLIEARDVQREIRWQNEEIVKKIDYNKKRRIIEEIAYWMLRNGNTSETESNVIEFLENMLKNTNIMTGIAEVEHHARVLLDYIVERSGIVRSPAVGEIDFIHKTFMEYLAAKAICRNCDYQKLVDEACNVNWKETIIMCFGEMSKKKVSEILEKLVDAGESCGEERYFFIASLGASNAILTDNHVRESIDDKIKKLIPPTRENISEIAQAGEYLLPFLNDSPHYTDEERELCIILLEYLDLCEGIPQLLSYILGCGNDYIKELAFEILEEYSENVLLEYDVKDCLYEQLFKEIKGEYLKIYGSLLRIVNDKKITKDEKEILSKIRDIELVDNLSYIGSDNNNYHILEYCYNATKVKIVGTVWEFPWLGYLNNLESLYIVANNDFSSCVCSFRSFANFTQLKKLVVSAEKFNYICANDFANMSNLEWLEIHTPERALEVEFDDLHILGNLKRLVIDVCDDDLRCEIMDKKYDWKSDLPSVYIDII